MTNNNSGFKWHSSDLELLAYFNNHPYFSVKYKRTDVRLDKREDFKVICNEAGKNLPRLQPNLHQKMYNIIVEYAKLYLLISRGQVTERELENTQCITTHLQKKLNFLKVYVSGFTDDDIPQAIHNYYDILFKVNTYVGQKTGVTIDEVNVHLRQRKKTSENKLHAKDMKFIRYRIRHSFKKPCDGSLTSCEARIFQALGLHNNEVKKMPSKHTTREVAVSKTRCNILPNININEKMSDSQMDVIEIFDSDEHVEHILRNNIPNHTKVTELPKTMYSVDTHENIKMEINDSEMDVVEHSVSNEIGGGTSMNNITTTYVIQSKSKHSALPKSTIKKKVNDIYKGNTNHGSVHGIVGDSSTNIIRTNTVAKPKSRSIIPYKKKIHVDDSGVGTIGNVEICQKVIDKNAMPNVSYGADLNKYMKDVADYLCRMLPMNKRRDLLNKVDVIVSKILEE